MEEILSEGEKNIKLHLQEGFTNGLGLHTVSLTDIQERARDQGLYARREGG